MSPLQKPSRPQERSVFRILFASLGGGKSKPRESLGSHFLMKNMQQWHQGRGNAMREQ